MNFLPTRVRLSTSHRGHRFLLRVIALLLAASSAFAAEAPVAARGIEIRDAWARIHPNNPGEIGVYFDILNSREDADKLVRVSSPVAAQTGLARLTFDRLRPRIERVAEVLLPASSTTALRPDGVYIVLSGAQSRLAPGDLVPLSLSFANIGQVDIDVRISNQLLGNRRK